MIRIAHLSDCHIPPLEHVKLKHLLSKRTFGYINWHRHRKFIHLKGALDKLVVDLKGAGADHIVCTGDLVNIGTPYEFEKASIWLQELGNPDTLSLVPGNHDSYVNMTGGTGQDFMGKIHVRET